MKRTIKRTVTYPHPRERVWAALTDSAVLGRWLMPNDFVPAVGHRFTLRADPSPGFDGIIECEVLALDPPRSMTWAWRGGPIDTQVAFELEEVEGGTRLQLVHSGFEGPAPVFVSLILGSGWRKLLGRKLRAELLRE